VTAPDNEKYLIQAYHFFVSLFVLYLALFLLPSIVITTHVDSGATLRALFRAPSEDGWKR
jgi:hypothetical protein